MTPGLLCSLQPVIAQAAAAVRSDCGAILVRFGSDSKPCNHSDMQSHHEAVLQSQPSAAPPAAVAAGDQQPAQLPTLLQQALSGEDAASWSAVPNPSVSVQFNVQLAASPCTSGHSPDAITGSTACSRSGQLHLQMYVCS